MNKKILLSSILSLFLCVCMIAGGTFALFTSESINNVAINSGKVEMVATLQNLSVYSPAAINADDYSYDATVNAADTANYVFANGGTAVLTETSLKLDKMTPGDKATFEIKLVNNSNVLVKYRTVIDVLNDTGLFAGLKISIGGEELANRSVTANWKTLAANVQPTPDVLKVVVELPADRGNEYQDKKVDISFKLEAVQGNTDAQDLWNGADMDVEGLLANTDTVAKTVSVDSAAQLATFAAAVNGTLPATVSEESLPVSFAGYTLTLTGDIDLNYQLWTPINGWDGVLNGMVIDGNGYAIKNMVVNGGDAAGFISNNASSITIKNLTFDNANVAAQSGNTTYAGVVIAKNYSPVTLDGVKVVNSYVTNNWQCGGLVGFAETNAPVFVNCSIENSFVGGYNCTAGLFFGLGSVNVSLTNCTAKGVDLYTDMKLDYIGYLYGKTLTATGCSMTDCQVVSAYK